MTRNLKKLVALNEAVTKSLADMNSLVLPMSLQGWENQIDTELKLTWCQIPKYFYLHVHVHVHPKRLDPRVFMMNMSTTVHNYIDSLKQS